MVRYAGETADVSGVLRQLFHGQLEGEFTHSEVFGFVRTKIDRAIYEYGRRRCVNVEIRRDWSNTRLWHWSFRLE